MKHRTPKVLYFSLVPSRITSFWKWVIGEGCQYCKNAVFSRAEAPKRFTHAADLPVFLNQYDGNLQSLHVIIDYESIKGIDNADIIRDTIIEFPEVQFLFDKHYAGQQQLSLFLFPEKELIKYIRSYPKEEQEKLKLIWKDIANRIDYFLIELFLNNPDDSLDSSVVFSRIINGYDNTFDASNLRYAIKYRKYLHLKVHHNRNFKNTQDSRFRKLAICIEEESRQNICNSYSLYANGFRVLPITTRQELESVNSGEFKLPSDSKNGIIIRDFDLQFEDEDQSPVDAIRGFRFCEANELKKDSVFAKTVREHLSEYHEGWNDLTNTYHKKNNTFWGNLVQYGFPLYFITKGPKHSDIVHPQKGSKVEIINNRKKLLLPGFSKPVCGLYSPFQCLPEVKAAYDDTRYSISDSEYEITTSRKEHDHSTPLDVYDMANNMIRRAEAYYNNGRYLLAALVAGEALEFLNGFHHRLMIKAYYIQAISENAISMDVVGGNEKYLAKDAQFRVEKIIEDVNRFYYGYEEKSSRNVLNQIFSTCRQFCKEHEHFESEEIFLSAMGHLLEGLSLYTLSKRLFKRLTGKKDS